MDRLEKISPKLTKVKKEVPFQVPENYFMNFPERLNEKIHSRELHLFAEKKILVFKPYLAAAVLVIIALISGILIFRNINEKRALQNFHTEISQTVERELYYISEELILEAMDYTDNQEGIAGQNHAGEIIDYLIQEDIPYDEIMDVY